MKYVFVDTDNGTATPGTAVHTSSSWPANGDRFNKLSSALGSTTVRAETDDLTIYCIGTAADTQTTSVTVSNAMSCASLLIEGNNTTGAWSTSHYRLVSTGSSNVDTLSLLNAGQTTTLRYMYVKTETTNATAQTAVNKNSNGNVIGDRCYFWAGGSGAVTNAYAFVTSNTITVTWYNCIFRATNTSATNNYAYQKFNATSTLYNCTVDAGTAAGSVGIRASTSTNCAVRAATQFSSAVATSYCASAAGTGTNAVTVSNWADQWVDGDAGDYRLKSGSSLIGAGIGPASDLNVPTTDIVGNARSGTTTDIGPYLYAPLIPLSWTTLL